jgi:hypothetical protein
LAGRPWCRACEAGPSPIEQARPACSSWPLLLSARVEHEPVGTQERPANEPAVARCLLHHVMVHSARSYIGRNTSFPALKLPSDLAREVAFLAVMRPRQRATGMQRSSYPGVSPPLDIRVQRIRVLKLPMARRRLTTVPGPDPVMPAAHERASTDAYWSSCCTAPELGRSFRRWPNRRREYAGTRQASAAAERPTSRHILGPEVAQRKK